VHLTVGAVKVVMKVVVVVVQAPAAMAFADGTRGDNLSKKQARECSSSTWSGWELRWPWVGDAKLSKAS
jgi:hypothetical protein